MGVVNSNSHCYVHAVVVSSRGHVPIAAVTEPAELVEIFESSGFAAGHIEVPQKHSVQLVFEPSELVDHVVVPQEYWVQIDADRGVSLDFAECEPAADLPSPSPAASPTPPYSPSPPSPACASLPPNSPQSSPPQHAATHAPSAALPTTPSVPVPPGPPQVAANEVIWRGEDALRTAGHPLELVVLHVLAGPGPLVSHNLDETVDLDLDLDLAAGQEPDYEPSEH